MTDLNPRRVDDHARITEALAAAPFAMLSAEYRRRTELTRVGRCCDCRKWLGECRCERAAVPVAQLREVRYGSPPEPSRVAVADACTGDDDRS